MVRVRALVSATDAGRCGTCAAWCASSWSPGAGPRPRRPAPRAGRGRRARGAPCPSPLAAERDRPGLFSGDAAGEARAASFARASRTTSRRTLRTIPRADAGTPHSVDSRCDKPETTPRRSPLHPGRRTGGPRHRDRIHGTPGPSWFDPASPIGRVHGDAAMFVGGIRAVLLQTLHPAAMTAVAEHSGYRGDMWGRLPAPAASSRSPGSAPPPCAAGGRRRARDPPRVSGTSTTGRRTPPPTRTCCCGSTSRRSTASCGPTRPTVGCRSTRRAATSTSPRPPGRPPARGPRPADTEDELADVLEAFRPELRVTPHAREAVRPAAAPRPPVRRPAGVRRARGRRHRLDARLGAT